MSRRSSAPNVSVGLATVMVSGAGALGRCAMKEKGTARLRLRARLARRPGPRWGLRSLSKLDDGVAGGEAGVGGGGVGGDVIDDGRAVEVLLRPRGGVGDEDEQHEGEDEVGDGAGEGDEHALPAGWALNSPGCAAMWLRGLRRESSPAILT